MKRGLELRGGGVTEVASMPCRCIIEDDVHSSVTGHYTVSECADLLNATGLMPACQLFSEPMQERHSGSIVNIGSIYGSVSPDFPLYEGVRAGNRIDYASVKGGILNLLCFSLSIPQRM